LFLTAIPFKGKEIEKQKGQAAVFLSNLPLLTCYLNRFSLVLFN
jgi:hypothetical protein